MENFGVSLNKIKQPKPDISAENGGLKRDIKNPYVGIISDINPTSTPVTDIIDIKKGENPRKKFAPQIKKPGLANFNNFATGGIITCGVLAVISLIKKFKTR